MALSKEYFIITTTTTNIFKFIPTIRSSEFPHMFLFFISSIYLLLIILFINKINSLYLILTSGSVYILISFLFSFSISFILNYFIIGELDFIKSKFIRAIIKFIIFYLLITVIIMFLSLFSLFSLYYLLPIVYNSSVEDELISKPSSSSPSNVVVDVKSDDDNYHLSIYKNLVFDSISTIGTTVKTGLSVLGPPLAGGGAAGVVASQLIKSTAHLPLGLRIAAVGAGIASTGILAGASFKAGASLVENKKIEGDINININIQNTSTPSNTTSSLNTLSSITDTTALISKDSTSTEIVKDIFIKSPLDSQTPLQELLLSLLMLDVSNLLFVIALILINLNKYFVNINFSLLDKGLKLLLSERIYNSFASKLNKGNNISNNFIHYISIFFIFSILIIIII